MHSWVTLDDNSPPEAYRAHLGTMRDNQQGGSYQPTFNLIPFSLRPDYVESLAVESYVVLVSNQQQWQLPILFCGGLRGFSDQ